MSSTSISADLLALEAELIQCRRCPRLVEWREQIAEVKKAAFQDETYWGKPVPSLGASDARLVIVGLAPSAHGGNRTGRMFTGDRSGEVLFQALYDVGLASQPQATHIGDGLELFGTRLIAPVHCAPPENKPTTVERDTCRSWLVRELKLFAPTMRSLVVLGAWGWQALMLALPEAGWAVPKPRPRFGHGARTPISGVSRLEVFGCFHVSQRNTQTGLLTPEMVRTVLREAGAAAGLEVR
jgi:uracil-DNA glycosylase family 4